MAKQDRASLLEFINPSRNYLTLTVLLIIALGLALGYAFASVSATLDSIQRWLFIVFLVIFSVSSFSLSLWLILRHSRKLAVSSKDGGIAWRIMSAQRQQQKLNLEIVDLARILSIPADQMSDLRSAYIVAEDLALRHIEKESETPLMRHIALGETEFDAILVNQEVIKCIEVTFLVVPDISDQKIAGILKKIDAVKKLLSKIRPDTKLILLLALVTQLDRAGEAKLRSIIGDKFTETPVDVDIRLFDFEELQKIFTA